MFGDDFILFLIVFALIIGLGGIIFINDKKNKLHQSFLLLSLTMAVWVFSNYMQDAVLENGLKILLIRVDFISAIFMSYAFFNFCYVFAAEYIKIKKVGIYKTILALISVAFSLLIIFSDKIIKKIVFLTDVITPVYGTLYYSYLTFLLFFLIAGLVFLLIKYVKEDVSTKKSTFLIISGFVLMIIVMIITNIILSIFFENSPNFLFYSRLGVYSVLILIGFMSYAIAKNNFLNIRIITTQLFSSAIVLVFFFEILSAQSRQAMYLKIILFCMVLYFARMIVGYAKLEVKRKEELQLMSDKLANANDQLRKLDNAKSEFISIASHQLRTPLTAIKGFVSLLLEGSYGKINPKQEDVLNKVYLSNDRLVNLVEDLLNISRIESGRMEFKFELWQAEDICQEVMDTFVIKAKEHGLSLTYKKPVELLPKIMVDGAKVREVISNMVDNAIKYTPKGGVTLKAEKLFGEAQKIPGDEGSVRVTVSDTGIGIPETELPYLFAKFSRGKDIKRLNAAGTGLGLYVGRNMIEASGGKIWAESAGEGKGSRFIIELPIGENKVEVEKRLEKFVEKL